MGYETLFLVYEAFARISLHLVEEAFYSRGKWVRGVHLGNLKKHKGSTTPPYNVSVFLSLPAYRFLSFFPCGEDIGWERLGRE